MSSFLTFRASEEKYRLTSNFLKEVQTQVDASMRARTIDFLVPITEKLMLVPETLYLTVNYMDRCLSRVDMDASDLNFLGIVCMMIASKYEENQSFAPRVEDFCRILEYTCSKEEVCTIDHWSECLHRLLTCSFLNGSIFQVVRMKSNILKCLQFEMAVPTTKWFLSELICAAQEANDSALLMLSLECLSDYIAEVSFQEYTMLCFAPSLVAASSTFLAKFMLNPTKKPWTSALSNYTHYRSSELQKCVMALHNLCCTSRSPDLIATREKYSQREYGFIAMMCRPPPIPQDFFQDIPETTSVQRFHMSNSTINAF